MQQSSLVGLLRGIAAFADLVLDEPAFSNEK
jgi:hypothetical protein